MVARFFPQEPSFFMEEMISAVFFLYFVGEYGLFKIWYSWFFKVTQPKQFLQL